MSALGGVRAGLQATTKAAVSWPMQQTRGVKTVDFAGHKEKVFGGLYTCTNAYARKTDSDAQNGVTGHGRSYW